MCPCGRNWRRAVAGGENDDLVAESNETTGKTIEYQFGSTVCRGRDW
jgi:hypothetical protein